MYPYHHVRTEDGRESLTVFMPTGAPVVATGDHPKFAELLSAAQGDGGAEDLRNLADLSNIVAAHFDTLSERVSVANGRVYFDGDEIDSTITQQIKRCLDDPNVGDWKPLVLFMENVAANPDKHSREQLFDWLRDREFTITQNGCFIAYKGVTSADGVYVSISRGHGIVNGESHTGQLPNFVGATVEMPRSDVQHDPSRGCHTGLHVGTHKYAEGYNSAALLTVLVNPRDVVSVPTDCNAEKMRVCRYVVQDDDPTPPEDSAAIAGPRTIYPVTEDLNRDLFYANYYTPTGEERPPRVSDKYVYGGSMNHAFSNHPGGDAVILEPTTPRPGDLLPDGTPYDAEYTLLGRTYVKSGVDRIPEHGDVYLSAYGGTFGEVLRAYSDHRGPRAVSCPILILKD